jgi:uncharacterized protein with GYD domain
MALLLFGSKRHQNCGDIVVGALYNVTRLVPGEEPKEKSAMPKYLIQAGYTPEAWGKLAAKPENRLESVRPAVEKAGAKIESSYLCFGDDDLIIIVDAPDNVTAAGLAIDFAGGGALRSVKTTPLMTWEEGVAAMKKAGEISYQPKQ